MKEVKRCPHCDAKMVEYKHTLNKNIIQCLWIVCEMGGILPFKELNGRVTYNQRNHFQQLQYWGLTRKVKDEDGTRVAGLWAITEDGMRFLKGEIPVFKHVWTYRGEFVRFDGEALFVSDYGYEPYKTAEQYAAEARPRYIKPDGQMEFF